MRRRVLALVSALGANSRDRALLWGMMWVAGFSLASKLAMATKDVAVAWMFGTGSVVDAYQFVFNIAAWPTAIVFSVVSVTVIPVEARLRLRSSAELVEFRGQQLGAATLVGLALAAAMLLALWWLCQSPLVGLPAVTAEVAHAMALPIAATCLSGTLAAVIGVWVMSDGGYLNTLSEGITPLVVVVALAFAVSWGTLAYGTLIGSVIQCALLYVYIRRQMGVRWSLSLRSSAWGELASGAAVVLISQLVFALSIPFDQLLAARQIAGSLSTFGYANKLIALLNAVVSVAVTRAMLPTFSRALATESTALLQTVNRWAVGLWVVGLLLAGASWLLGQFFIARVFQHGSFTAADSSQVAHLFNIGLWQIPFYFAGMAYASYLASLRRYAVLLVSAVVGIAVKLVAVVAAISRLGVTALPMSGALMYAATATYLYYASQRERA